MMIADESHVPKEAPKILPAGKFADVDHQPLQVTMRFDPVIGGERQRVEILRAQGLLDFDHDHARVGKDTMRNSGAFRKRVFSFSSTVSSFSVSLLRPPYSTNSTPGVSCGQRPSSARFLLLRSEDFLHLPDFLLNFAADLFDLAFGYQAGIVRGSSNFLFSASFHFMQPSPPIRAFPSSRDWPLAVRGLPNSFA